MGNELGNGSGVVSYRTFRCICGAEYELPVLSQGQRVQCEKCGTKYEMSDGELVIVAQQRSMRSIPVRASSPTPMAAPKMPVVMIIAVSLVFVFTALSFLGTAGQNAIGALSAAALLLGLGLGLCSGKNWCRIALTVLVGFVWILACMADMAAGIIILALWSAPLVLIWLPASSEWFRMKRWWVQEQERLNPASFALRRKIEKNVGLLLLAAVCMYCSGLSGTMVVDKCSLSEVSWKAGFWGFVPIAPLFAFMYLCCSIFSDGTPFWPGFITGILSLTGWGIVGDLIPETKKEEK